MPWALGTASRQMRLSELLNESNGGSCSNAFVAWYKCSNCFDQCTKGGDFCGCVADCENKKGVDCGKQEETYWACVVKACMPSCP